MDALKPSPQNAAIGRIAEALLRARGWLNETFAPGNAGYHGVVKKEEGTPLGTQLMGRGPEEMLNWSYGNSPFKDKPVSGVSDLLPQLQERRAPQVFDALTLLPAMGPLHGEGAALSNFSKLLEHQVPEGMVPVFRGTFKRTPRDVPYRPQAAEAGKPVFTTDNPILALTYTMGRDPEPDTTIASGLLKRPPFVVDAQGARWHGIASKNLPEEFKRAHRDSFGEMSKVLTTDDIAEILLAGDFPSVEIRNVYDLATDVSDIARFFERTATHPEMQAFREALRREGVGRIGPILDQPNTVYIGKPDEYEWVNW